MNFDEIPTIPVSNIYRAAHVSGTRGEKALNRLVDERLIRPMRTPTGRVLLTPSDGRAVFEALLQGI